MLESTLHSGLETGSPQLRRSVSASTGPHALPDLLLIDGGPGQLAQAAEVLKELLFTW